MPNSNGAKPPIPFPAGAASVPILGQPYRLRCVIPTVMATCNCDAKEPILLIGLGSQCNCPACGRVFILREFSGSAATGQMNAAIEVGVRPDRHAEGAAAVSGR